MSFTVNCVRSATSAFRAFSVTVAHQVRVYVHSECTRAAFRRFDHDPPVAGTQIDEVAAFFTSAMRNIRSTISIGVCTYGTVPSSKPRSGAAPAPALPRGTRLSRL